MPLRSFTNWPQDLQKAVRREARVNANRARNLDECDDWLQDDGSYRCPMCVTKTFSAHHAQRDLHVHIQNQHVKKEYGTECTKHCRYTHAIYSDRKLASATSSLLRRVPMERESSHFLEESANIMREDLEQSPSWRKHRNEFAKLSTERLTRCNTIMLLDMERTRLILKEDVGSYHRISAQYAATDHHIWSFLGACLHPHTIHTNYNC